MDWTLNDLEMWNSKIEKLVRSEGLDYYPQEFEIINYNEMMAYEAYVGMPSRYPHWSFGKSYEKIKTLYSYNLTGLAYEMVINSNPCIAYLMKENTLLLQILTIAHVYGHNDFFKNNRLFKEGTDAGYTLEMFKNNAMLVRNLINDPSIGYENVEKMLNAAHSVKLQTTRAIGPKRRDREELKQEIMESFKERSSRYNILEPRETIDLPNLNKIPLEPEDNLLYFIIKYGDLEEWQKSILEVVRRETEYFIPQIETKIMNEGWASYWHYKTLQNLDLPQSLHLEFVKRHNDVVRPILGGLNPYYLGFEMYKDIAERYGEEKIFEVREFDRDASFVRRYLTEDLCKKLNLFEYVKKGPNYIIEEVSDEKGWEEVRNTIADSAGMGSVPYIRVTDMSRKDKALTLEHVFDGRELNLTYAEETLKSVFDLWGHKVILRTMINDKELALMCDEERKIKPAPVVIKA